MTETVAASGNTPATAGASPAAAPAAASTAPAAPAAAPVAATSQQAPAGQTAAPAPAPAAATTASETSKEGAQAPAAPPAVPEKYEFKAPPGTQLDAEAIAAYSELAKEMGLSQDAAQKVIDKLAPKLAAQSEKSLTQAIQSAATAWTTAIKSDKEIGGEKLGENLAVAKRAVEHFATKELRELLSPFDRAKNPRGMGLGNHPELVRLFVRLGKGLSEDKFVPGARQPSQEERKAADVLYPTK